MSERVPAQNKTSATPSQATQACSPLLHRRPLTDEQSESLGSNSSISQELGEIQPKTIRRSLNWRNISVEAPARSSETSSQPIQRQQEEQEETPKIQAQLAVDSAQKSALESSNSTISTSKPAQKPLISRTPFNGRNILVEAPQRLSASSAYPEGIQRLETSGVNSLGKGGSFKLAPGGFQAHEGDVLSSEDDGKQVHLLTKHGQDVTSVYLKERLEKPLQVFLEVRQKRVKLYEEQIVERTAAITRMSGQMPKYKENEPEKYQKWLDGLERNQSELKTIQKKKAELMSIKEDDKEAIKRVLEESEKDLKSLGYKKSDITFQATKFYNKKVMEKAVMEALKENQQKINEGFTDKQGNSTEEGTTLRPPIEHRLHENIGIGYELNSKMEAVPMGPLRKVTVIVVLSDSKNRLYKVETAYPGT